MTGVCDLGLMPVEMGILRSTGKAASVLTVLLQSMAGCGPAEHPEPAAHPEQPSAGAATLSSEDAARFCVTLHEQMASCAPEFIDMNIDLRSKYFPAFAQKASDPATRAEMRDEGIKEALADGTGPLEPRQERCKQYVEHGPPVPSGDVAQATVCFKKATCAEKMACLRPSQEQRYQDRAKDPGESTPEGAPKMK